MALDEIVRTTKQLRQVWATILTQNKDLTDTAQLKTFITPLKEDVVLCEAG